MPRTMPTGAAAEFRKRHRPAPVKLLDMYTVNAQSYYWSDVAGLYPSRIGVGGSLQYAAYLRSCGPFRLSRSLRTDGGEILVQNLSGTTIDRDIHAQMRGGEFEGALAVFRLWDLLLGDGLWEFHGWLTTQETSEVEARFAIKQLLDPGLIDLPFEQYNANCSWLYKSAPCGSAGTAPSCTHTIAACKDPTRNAFHRFNGTPVIAAVRPAPHPAPRFPTWKWSDRRPYS